MKMQEGEKKILRNLEEPEFKLYFMWTIEGE